MDEENCPTLFLNSVFTSIYIPTILVILNYTNTLFDLGQHTTYIEWVLISAELIKYILCHYVYQEGKKNPKRSNKKVELKQIFEECLVLFVICAAFYFSAVIFGAPVLSQHYETFFFSMLMTILTALPCLLHLDVEHVTTLFLSLFEGTDLHLYYFWNIRLTILGSWLGAVVIPLDWNRPYQKWPVSCCIGAMGGCYLANIFALLHKRFYKKKVGKFNLCEYAHMNQCFLKRIFLDFVIINLSLLKI